MQIFQFLLGTNALRLPFCHRCQCHLRKKGLRKSGIVLCHFRLFGPLDIRHFYNCCGWSMPVVFLKDEDGWCIQNSEFPDASFAYSSTAGKGRTRKKLWAHLFEHGAGIVHNWVPVWRSLTYCNHWQMEFMCVHLPPELAFIANV